MSTPHPISVTSTGPASSSESKERPLVDRLPYTLDAINRWPDPKEVLDQHERDLDTTLLNVVLTPSYRNCARHQRLLDLYENSRCFRFLGWRGTEWYMRLVKARATVSPSWDTIGLGGPFALNMRLACCVAKPPEYSATASIALQDALKPAARLFNLTATTLADSKSHQRNPHIALALTNEQLTGAELNDDKSWCAALKGFHALKVVQMRLPHQGKSRSLPANDIIREVHRSQLGARFLFDPDFVRFMSRSLAGQRAG